MSEQTIQSKKITIGLVLSWTFGVLFALVGITSVSSELIPGLAMLGMAAVLLPPVVKMIEQRWNFHLSNGMKIVVVVIGFVVYGATVDTTDVSTTQQPVVPVEKQQISNDEAVTEEPKEEEPKEEEPKEEEPQTETDEQANKLGISYDQMMNYLSNFFIMEKSTPVDGEDRYMGQTSNGLATLEIIGDKDNISQTSLMIGIPSDDPGTIIENSAILIRFLKNAVPEWEKSGDWATESMERMARSSNTEDETVYGDKNIKMMLLKDFGILTVTVKHK